MRGAPDPEEGLGQDDLVEGLPAGCRIRQRHPVGELLHGEGLAPCDPVTKQKYLERSRNGDGTILHRPEYLVNVPGKLLAEFESTGELYPGSW